MQNLFPLLCESRYGLSGFYGEWMVWQRMCTTEEDMGQRAVLGYEASFFLGISPTHGVIQLEYSLPCHPHTHTRLSSGRSQFQKKKQVNAFLSLLTRRQQQHSVHWPLRLYRHAVTSLCSPWSLRAEASQVQRQGFVTGPLALSLSEHPLSKTVDLHTGKDVQCPIYIMRFPSTILC